PCKSSRAHHFFLYYSIIYPNNHSRDRGLLVYWSMDIGELVSQIDTATENPRVGTERGPRARIGLIPTLGTIFLDFQSVIP
ncbi:MAG: hypothetical protein O6932_11205, partial [Gammaproteobacteria bacterium]|nr:hypothetical protein [Gammaproteobacteria bacterium]